MDFLDPKKRRAYHIRLVVGYILVGIVIGLATIIIVYGANGYGINTKTGQIVQNGLLFLDSNPTGAEVYLNGQDRHTTTSARLILPGGTYTLTLKKSGYRDWSNSFTLNGSSVARYVYPFLFPVKPLVTKLQTYDSAPKLVTQSPSQRWLLVENNKASSLVPTFDEYDTTTLDDASPAVQQISMPSGLLTDYSASSKLKVVEWSTDNNNVLIKHTYGKHTEFVVFNRAKPDQSFNVNKMFDTTPTLVNLFNKKTSQLYIYQSDGSLQLGDTSTKKLAAPILKNVLAYKPYGTDLITYVTDNGEPSGMVEARIWNNGQTYGLYEFKAGEHYLIDMAQYSGHFYYVAGSDKADRINIYEDPLNDIKNPSVGKALPMIAMVDPGADKLGFSTNARFVGAESGQRFAVYDFETQTLYQYSIKNPLAADLSWMDGHRLIGESKSEVFVMDYDGTNKQVIDPTSNDTGALFSADYHHMLTVAPGSKGSAVLEDIDMRAGVDLPNSKQ
ncbi:MAG TPA: PEGA domain-containing protein [Candidatus Saccharimonadales bacterium]|nr:PEGA domain-containing protein [Candidatus Saccharimonadales bacterium]